MKARAETSFMDTVRNLVLKVAPGAATKVESQPTMSQWMMQILRRMKYAACTPAAAAVYPYIGASGREGTYLY